MDFGGTGGGPILGSVTVRVVAHGLEDAYGDPVPIEGAMVMVGARDGFPFDGNVGSTDADGYVSFIDPVLDGPQTVTAGAAGHGYFTFVDVDAAQIVIPLDLYDPTIWTAEVSGTWTGFPAIHRDGYLQAGATFPSLTLMDAMRFDIDSLLGDNECIYLDFLGWLPIPGALVIPDDEELIFGIIPVSFDKSTYHVKVPMETTRSFFGFGGDAEFNPLIGMFLSGYFEYADIIAALDPKKIGIARDLYVGGPTIQGIDLEADLTANLTLNVDGTPAGSDVYIASMGEINGAPGVAPGAGELILMGLTTVEGGTPESVLVHTAPASGSFWDLRYLASAVAKDEAFRYSALLDRSDYAPPATRDMDAFFSFVDLYPVQGASFSYSDAYNPGVSPFPDLQVSDLSLVEAVPGVSLPCDPAPIVEKRKTFWTVYAPGSDLTYQLPMLPDEAPLAIPDPLATPAADLLEWSQSSFSLELAGAFDLNNYDFDTFTETVTAMSGNSASFTFDGDGDGYLAVAGDCDDSDPDVNPGTGEICDNEIDDDCDWLIDSQDPDCRSGALLAFIRHKLNDNQSLNIYSVPTVVEGDINPLLASDVWIGNVGSDNEIAHMAGGDLDGDGYDELICIRQKLTGVQFLTIYDPPVEVGGDINPLLASDKWIGKVGMDNQITHLAAGDMDGDEVDELIFIRERTNGNQYLNIYDAPTVVAGEINPLIASDTWIGNLGDRSEIMFMAVGDIGADGDDELLFVRNRQNNNQYLNIYDIPTEVDGDINPLLASDLWIANLGSNNEITHIGTGDTDGDGTDELILVRHRLNDNQYLNIYDIPTELGGEINPIIASDLWIGNVGTANEITHMAVIAW